MKHEHTHSCIVMSVFNCKIVSTYHKTPVLFMCFMVGWFTCTILCHDVEEWNNGYQICFSDVFFVLHLIMRNFKIWKVKIKRCYFFFFFSIHLRIIEFSSKVSNQRRVEQWIVSNEGSVLSIEQHLQLEICVWRALVYIRKKRLTLEMTVLYWEIFNCLINAVLDSSSTLSYLVCFISWVNCVKWKQQMWGFLNI